MSSSCFTKFSNKNINVKYFKKYEENQALFTSTCQYGGFKANTIWLGPAINLLLSPATNLDLFFKRQYNIYFSGNFKIINISTPCEFTGLMTVSKYIVFEILEILKMNHNSPS